MAKTLTSWIGIRIANCRKAAKLTQEDLADKLNINRLTINRIETGKQLPSLKYIYEFSIALNVSIDELLPTTEQLSLYFLGKDVVDMVSKENADSLQKMLKGFL